MKLCVEFYDQKVHIARFENHEIILQVQGKDPSVDNTQDLVEESEDERFDDGNDSNIWVELPACDLSKLEQISEV